MLFEGSRSMRGYGQVDEDLDDYEDDFVDRYGGSDADEYEDDEDEEEGQEEQEEPISEEKLRYLDLRQKLKEAARSKIRKENGEGANKSQDRNRVSPLGRFGSFFGPSKPVIADRVIQESKSLLETRHLTAKQSTPPNDGKKVTVPSTSKSSNGVSNRHPNNQVKSKAQILKQTRDFYSSLLSDDAEIPKPGGDPGFRKNIVSKTDSRSVQVLAKSSGPSSSSRKGLNGHEQRKPSSGIPQPRAAQTAPSQKMVSGSRANFVYSDSKRQLDLRRQPQSHKQLGSSNSNGSVRSAVPKVLPSKKPSSSSDKKAPVGATERKVPIPVGNKASTVSKNSTSNGQRLPSMKPQPSVRPQPSMKPESSVVSNSLVNKRDIQRSSESKMLKKENISAPKLQTMKPPKQDPSRSNLGKDRYVKEQKPSGQLNGHKSSVANKKRRADEAFSDDEFDYRSVIRGMFGRPRHYEDVDDDDDDMCMEVGFDAIQREESRSAKIAKKEDDEELVKILEEERQERLRKQARLRKNQR